MTAPDSYPISDLRPVHRRRPVMIANYVWIKGTNQDTGRPFPYPVRDHGGRRRELSPVIAGWVGQRAASSPISPLFRAWPAINGDRPAISVDGPADCGGRSASGQAVQPGCPVRLTGPTIQKPATRVPRRQGTCLPDRGPVQVLERGRRLRPGSRRSAHATAAQPGSNTGHRHQPRASVRPARRPPERGPRRVADPASSRSTNTTAAQAESAGRRRLRPGASRSNGTHMFVR
jgi:hypothetical protein